MTGQSTDRTLFAWLLLASLLGLSLGVPFRSAFLGDSDPQRIWLWAGMEFLFLLAPASAVGVWLGRKVDLGPRLMREFVLQTPGRLKRAFSILIPSTAIGLVFGIPLSLGPGSAYLGPGIAKPTAVEFFLGALSAGLTEEILFRLGLMTFFVWILRSIVNRPTFAGPSVSIGNIMAALVFAGAHLPHVVMSGTAPWDLVMGVVLFNGFAGIAMGWLYTRYGLISAILAHFLGDVVGYAIPSMI
ncbi:MAG: CPBP family intramembrane metalloprotease [Candidatus Aminicenantes bacterium]|nr:CPBP family intramembrane metalloprotease [Candidatus Aminicenantes bacterium]NIM80239.1 CPBP family intramembrane metalloprotease [Candidatus Aminicenantes bacterium]NIN19589.1 CPBP family intramembrane metalloprotease [Candidatus Aminicenantes bacterium]NIN43473.1 CPBP family intramembrane metalloprotease [Candidatus Aminicenantes bacterium]NIN86218.1 CPBP family intramembrane metalloprotease [Candidatus Aminicenantes bacterium]